MRETPADSFLVFPQRLKDGTPSIPKDVTEIVFFYEDRSEEI